MMPMKPKVPPPALRAARALFGLSQQALADTVKLSLRGVRMSEREIGAGEEVNSKLRHFYECRGVVFLGTVEIGSGLISACGVRYWDPAVDAPSEIKVTDVHSTEDGISFAAARFLLNLSIEEVAKGCGIARNTIGALERGADTTSTEKYKKLVNFFEERNIEFLWRRDIASRRFFGVGVRLVDAGAT